MDTTPQSNTGDRNVREAFDRFGERDWQTVEEGTLRVAMIGLGWWTRDHAIPAVADSDLCETTVLVTSSTEKAESVAEEVPTAEAALTYDEFHDGAASDAYDAVYICTPNALHLEYARTAAELGKAILCEKPMEGSVERAEELVEVCEEHDATLMIAYRMQTDPAIRAARRLVRDGFVGDPVHVNGHMMQPLMEMIPNPDQWRLNPDLSGYGTSIMDLGIYPVNTARFVLDADPVAVQARVRSESDEFADVPDEWASFTVEYDNGVLASCAASQHAEQSGRFEVIGTEGRIELEPAFFNESQRTLTVARGDVTSEVEFAEVDQMEEEFDYFADRVLSGTDPRPDGRHGLIDLRTLAALYEAGESSETVSL